MEILRSLDDQNIVINQETDFQTNAGWEESMVLFEDEVLSSILNPVENYETVRYIHKPYSGLTSNSNDKLCDIWFKFYFLSGTTYISDYNPQGIDTLENAKMLREATNSFFRLEFFKTPGTVTNNVLTCEAPTRQNRKLVFAQNLSLPLGEKYFFNGNNINQFIHIPVFTGSNYRNTENMYFFWFTDESVLTESFYSGSTTGNTFFMTAKFYNASDGSITDFTNRVFATSHEIIEQNDMYYQINIDKRDNTYQVYRYTGGTLSNRVGTYTGATTPYTSISYIDFYERGGGTLYAIPTPTPTSTPTPTPSYSVPVTTTPPSTSPPPAYYYLKMLRCDEDPSLLNYYYTVNTYISTGITRGDLFRGGSNGLPGSPPAGFFYYTVVDLLLTNPNGTINGSKSVAPYALTCGQDPTHYIAPVYRTAHINLFRNPAYTSYTQIQTGMCGKDPSQFASGFIPSGAYAGAFVTGTTLTPGVLYDLYQSATDGTPKWTTSGNYWWGATVYDTHSRVDYIVRIENGAITEWRDCTSGNIIYS